MSDFDSQLPVRSKDDLDERVLIKIQDADDPQGAGKTATVANKKLHVAIHNSDSTEITENCPLPVYLAEHKGDEVDEFDRSIDTPKNAVDNHDYTISSDKEFKNLEAPCSGSGKARFALQVETGIGTGVFNTVAVGFNSTSNPQVLLKYKKPVSAGLVIRVAKTNLDNQSQDLYSQIVGIEI
jgi:hypothetical protein